MEINPRLSASVELAVRAGVDFPYLLYQWANGDPLDHVKGYLVGGWMRYLGGDVRTTVKALLQRGRPGVSPPAQAIFDFFISFFRPMGYDYLDWKDPLPAYTAKIEFTRHIVKLLRDKLPLRWSARARKQEETCAFSWLYQAFRPGPLLHIWAGTITDATLLGKRMRCRLYEIESRKISTIPCAKKGFSFFTHTRLSLASLCLLFWAWQFLCSF